MDIKFFSKIARTFLGLVLIIFGVNFFYDFIGIVFPPGEAADFMSSLENTGFMIPLLAVSQIVLGFCLVANIFVPLALLLLLPINVNILLFNVFIAPVNMSLSIVMFVSQLFLFYLYKDSYKSLLKV